MLWGTSAFRSAKQRSAKQIKKMYHFRVLDGLFLIWSLLLDGARGSQKTFCPKTQGKWIGIRPEYFSCKEIACALQYLYVKLLYHKTRIVRFLRALLNLFLNGPKVFLLLRWSWRGGRRFSIKTVTVIWPWVSAVAAFVSFYARSSDMLLLADAQRGRIFP